MTRKKELYKEADALTVSHDIRVRFNETDPLGIVWHGYYITYFEDGREAFGRHHGISYLDILETGYTTPIV
jgi:acyl-CoA thioester hydrolase